MLFGGLVMSAAKAFDVDAVFCISLKEREDRREILSGEIKKISSTVEYILVDKDIENPQRGCFKSHVLCAKLAVERNYSRVLVLEDDVFFRGINSKEISRINQFLKKNNPDAFYLGALLGKVWLTWSYKIARVRGQGAHAIILNKKSCQKIASLKYTGKGIDSVYSKIFKSYTHIPMVAFQQPEEIFKSDLDEFRKHKGKDIDFWDNNYKKQYYSVLKNIFKTVFRVDL